MSAQNWLDTISIHAPRGGSDAFRQGLQKPGCNFNPRSPWGERQYPLSGKSLIVGFQSTLPVGGATVPHPPGAGRLRISIHAPRGGSDDLSRQLGDCCCISIHAPRGGSDPNRIPCSVNDLIFQSTLPVGGATLEAVLALSYREISIHAPRGGSDLVCRPDGCAPMHFNPRSPWGERLGSNTTAVSTHCKFQSTLPVGGATYFFAC